MSRRLVLISSFVGLAASVPLIYQSNPAYFMSWFEPQPSMEETAALESAPSKSQDDRLQGRRVRIEANEGGHYVASFKLNGRNVDAMIDTGASVVAINETTARRIGLSLKPSDYTHEVQTANGGTPAAAATIGDMQIGKIIVKDVQAVVLKDKALNGTLIGVSFLQKIASWRVDDSGMVLEQ